MNNKYIFLCLFMAVTLFSCSEADTESRCPTWKGFTYYTGNYPNYTQGRVGNVVLHPGDSIHLTAHQEERGRLINATAYYWTICYDSLYTKGNDDPDDDVIVHVQEVYPPYRTNYDGYADGADDPVCHMLLPAKALATEGNKRDTIKFVAYYKYSGVGGTFDNGNIVDNTSYNGRITPQSSAYDGGAVGYFYFSVQ